ncbi:MAG: peptidoglycan-binding protein, partial [Candidatus Pacebacteria bacterium]|nr:peptidoglycan-binding protein [Candidatus Paceibacterota bacterium]
ALTGEIVSTKEEVKDGISWIQITFKNGLKGWVSSKYISKVASTTSSVNTPTTSSGKPSSSLPTTGVNRLSNLENVKTLQAFLNWVLGSMITPLVVDGKYGPKTTETIRLYQSMNGLTADGLFGKNSSSKANSLISN